MPLRIISSPSFSLHRIAAAMSSRPPFRGGRGRGRSYSDRQPAVVTGDSHFNSVHHTNSSFHHQHHHNNYHNVNYQYNNNINRSDNSRNIRGGYHKNNGGPNFQPQIQSYNPRPSFNRRPPNAKPRPPDFRLWEYSHHPPPPHSERFVVLSYNILADYLANSHRNLYFHIPRRFMSWDWRKGNLLFELNLWSPDIMCFQEVDKYHELEEDLRSRGFNGIWKMRTGEPIDGCATFWRASRFKLVYEESIEFNKHGMRDNVAQICVLESLIQNHTHKTSSESTGGPNRVVMCNIHVLYNPRRGEIKLGQVRMLLERAQSVSEKWDDAPVVLCGDFNCTPKSPLYNFISEQKLDISELGRDNVSGQASAELRPAPRQYGNARERSTGNVATSAMVQNDSGEGNPNASLENQNASERILEDLPAVSSLHQPPQDETSHNGEDFSIDSGLSATNLSADKLQDEGQGDHCKKRTDDSRPAGDLNTSLAFKNDIDEKLVALSLSERDEPVEDDENLGEDAGNFMSELNNDGGAFPPNLGDMVEDLSSTPKSGAGDVDKLSYDPSRWTPMEIATATGNANRTVLEHSLNLTSTYTEVEDRSGTRDSNGEPLVTSYNRCFMGTVDYIWRSEGLRTVKVLAPIPKDVMQPSGGFPTKKWGSDHIALASELAFTK